jgi:hypothetical protein
MSRRRARAKRSFLQEAAAGPATLKPTWMVAAKAPITVQPTVDGGAIYWGAWDGYERATTSSGTQLWRTFLGTTTASLCNPVWQNPCAAGI